MAQKLKQASTLIITCASKTQAPFDYKIMLLKRSSRMRVAPEHHVFPGGGFSSSDQSLDWLSILLEKSNPGKQDLDVVRKKFHKIIHKNSLGNLIEAHASAGFHLPFEISHRLCAIRETFEETGLLLAYNKSNSPPKLDSKIRTCYYEKKMQDLDKWQDRVRNDSKEFLSLCLEKSVVPDLLGLHEWANWVTPTNEKRRFNTFFFTCFLENLPTYDLLSLDTNEIECMNFYDPRETLDKHKRNELKFIPPQLYEFSRIEKLKSFEKFSEYSLHRQSYGLRPWQPKFTNDGLVGLLPGDYLYDVFGSEINLSSSELNERYLKDKSSDSADLKVNRILRKRSAEYENKSDGLKILSNYDFGDECLLVN